MSGRFNHPGMQESLRRRWYLVITITIRSSVCTVVVTVAEDGTVTIEVVP